MRFGIATFITDEGIRPDVLGCAVEERGFSSLFIAEHSHIPVSRESPYPGGGELPRRYYRTLDPFVALTAAAEQGRDMVRFTVFGADTDEKRLAGFAEAGVEEITLTLDTLPEDDTLRSLDALTAVAAAHR